MVCVEHYPQCRLHSHKLFNKLPKSPNESGTFGQQASNRRRPKSISISGTEVCILRRVEEDSRNIV
jgi:hypothetical protein